MKNIQISGCTYNVSSTDQTIYLTCLFHSWRFLFSFSKVVFAESKERVTQYLNSKAHQMESILINTLNSNLCSYHNSNLKFCIFYIGYVTSTNNTHLNRLILCS